MSNSNEREYRHREVRKTIRQVRKQIKRNRQPKPARRKNWMPDSFDDLDELTDLPQTERIMPRGERERRQAVMDAALATLEEQASADSELPTTEQPIGLQGVVIEVSSGLCRVDLGDRGLTCTLRGSLTAQDTGFTLEQTAIPDAPPMLWGRTDGHFPSPADAPGAGGSGIRCTVNGKPVLIRGGGWVDDLLLSDTVDKLEAQLAYVAQMNLNTIRLEGFWGSNHALYDIADRLGILVMPGWSCHWEWEDYLGKPVDMDQATDEDTMRYHSDFIAGDNFTAGQKVFWSTWGLQESETGIYGDPTVATIETGREIMEAILANGVAFAKEFWAR